MICIWLSANHSSRFESRTNVVLSENSSATGSDTCWARIGSVKSTGARGLPEQSFNWFPLQILPSLWLLLTLWRIGVLLIGAGGTRDE